MPYGEIVAHICSGHFDSVVYKRRALLRADKIPLDIEIIELFHELENKGYILDPKSAMKIRCKCLNNGVYWSFTGKCEKSLS